MTKQKSTKRAFLSAVLALLVCVSMLIGTTFAWFTDSVTSGKNIIMSGNLDVELEYYNGETKSWEKVSQNTNVFEEDTLWEPGHTEVVYLKVSNLGTLALKYALNINIADETESVNVNGEVFRLSDYIEYDVVEVDAETMYADRAAARKAVADDTGFDAVRLNEQYYNKTGILYPENDLPDDGDFEQYITMVVYMPEEIGNEANYRAGEAVPEITLGINLVATQQMYEDDSFGADYDKNAQHSYKPTATVTEITVKDTEMFVVDINNGVEDTDAPITLDAAYEFRTVDNADTVALNTYGDWLTDYYVSIDRPIEDGVMLAGYYEGYPWIAIKAPAGDYTEAVGLLGMFSTGGISNWTYADIVTGVNTFKCGVVNSNSANAGATMTVQLRMINPENTAEYIVISETKYTFTTEAGNQSELNAAIENGATAVELGAGTYTVPSAVAGKDITIVGSGDSTVLDFTKINTVSDASITFENLKITGKNANEMSGYGIQHTTGDIVYKNCTFENAVTSEFYGNVSYIDCTFTGTYYIATYAVDSATFENCVFDRTDSRAILVYSHDDNPLQVTVKGCEFKAAAKGYTGVPAWTAAVEIDTTHIKTAGTTVTIEDCTYDANYNGIVRDKSGANATLATITVDGKVIDNSTIKDTGYALN